MLFSTTHKRGFVHPQTLSVIRRLHLSSLESYILSAVFLCSSGLFVFWQDDFIGVQRPGSIKTLAFSTPTLCGVILQSAFKPVCNTTVSRPPDAGPTKGPDQLQVRQPGSMESISVASGCGLTEEPLQLSGISPTPSKTSPAANKVRVQDEGPTNRRELEPLEDKLEHMIPEVTE